MTITGKPGCGLCAGRQRVPLSVYTNSMSWFRLRGGFGCAGSTEIRSSVLPLSLQHIIELLSQVADFDSRLGCEFYEVLHAGFESSFVRFEGKSESFCFEKKVKRWKYEYETWIKLKNEPALFFFFQHSNILPKLIYFVELIQDQSRQEKGTRGFLTFLLVWHV